MSDPYGDLIAIGDRIYRRLLSRGKLDILDEFAAALDAAESNHLELTLRGALAPMTPAALVEEVA